MELSIQGLDYQEAIDNKSFKIFLFISKFSEIKIPRLGFLNEFIINRLEKLSLRLLFEISGLNNFVQNIDKKEGEKLIELLSRTLKLVSKARMEFEKNSNGYKSKELINIYACVIEETEKIIEKIEDSIYENAYYNLTLSSVANDWDNPENDIWDTY